MLAPFRYRSLAFPCRGPGFDPTHIAAGGIAGTHGLSAVAMNGNLVNLLNGQKGTISGTVTNTIYAPIGPTAGQNGIASQMTFTGMSTATDSMATFGIILTPAHSFVGGDAIVGNQTSGGAALRYTSSASTTTLTAIFVGLSTPITSSFSIAENIPYFLACSIVNTSSGQTANFIAVNLLTGQIYSSTGTAAKVTPAAYSGTIYVGFGGAFLGYVAAAMWAPSYMSLSALLQWAQSPWDFWYPPRLTVPPMLEVGLYPTPSVTGQHFLTLMGMGL